jgi:nicotinate-nucleotide pyrophosphorylase
VNCDGVASGFSPAVVVATMLETPLAPRLAPARSALPSTLRFLWDHATRAGGGLLHRCVLRAGIGRKERPLDQLELGVCLAVIS